MPPEKCHKSRESKIGNIRIHSSELQIYASRHSSVIP
ncbi:hypothetical protein D2E24_1838 [Bifidobacterium samirii]|uniref:Uncharacterized protein n=1 Tax=Bifidobacterium samirii TaxID=2306974 RepID=A0A430FGA1_9BIFI|nr:hypothetical protein D2E24_1838 [Bifidobacterium samirii]